MCSNFIEGTYSTASLQLNFVLKRHRKKKKKNYNPNAHSLT